MGDQQKTSEKGNIWGRLKEERAFLVTLVIAFCVAAAVTGNPQIAMWVGFLFAGYSAIANDSIQTIGTFIASNQQKPWWHLWIFIGGVFVATMTVSWLNYGGPVYINLSSVTPQKDNEGVSYDVRLMIMMEEGESGTLSYREMKLDTSDDGIIKDREALGVEVEKDYRITGVSLGHRIPPSADAILGFATPKDKETCLTAEATAGKPCWLWRSESIINDDKASGNEDFAAAVWGQPLPAEATSFPAFDFSLASNGSAPEGDGEQKWVLNGANGTAIGFVTINPDFGGDVSNGRLLSKGFDTQTNDFHFLQLTAPLFLILLTRLRMPVSTTFLLLNVFAASGKAMGAVAFKSISGYVIAFMASIIIWSLLGPAMKRWFSGPAHPGWRVAQWITTGCLWSVWLMQDAANIAVFLPRSLTQLEFMAFCAVIVAGLGYLFWMGGEKIQEVVNEKSNVVDVRAATVLDFVYAVILYIFKFVSQIPMSTTWVFVGLLAGREIAMTSRGAGEEGRNVKTALQLAGRDLLYVTIGFVISVILAALINPAIADALFG